MKVKSQYFCTVCRSHNIMNSLKGHKFICPFLDCLCEICKIKSKRLNVNMEVTVESVPIQDPTISSNEVKSEVETLQGVITTDPQGNIFFIPNCTIVLSMDTQIFNGYNLITSKI